MPAERAACPGQKQCLLSAPAEQCAAEVRGVGLAKLVWELERNGNMYVWRVDRMPVKSNVPFDASLMTHSHAGNHTTRKRMLTGGCKKRQEQGHPMTGNWSQVDVSDSPQE